MDIPTVDRRTAWKRHLYAVMDFGRAEWWAYGTLLAWLVLVPVAIWASGQAAASASAWMKAIEAGQSVPTLNRADLSIREMEDLSKLVQASFPGFKVETSSPGRLQITAKTPDQYQEWLALMSVLPSLRKKVLWSITEMCVNSEVAKCNGGVISVDLKAEIIQISEKAPSVANAGSDNSKEQK